MSLTIQDARLTRTKVKVTPGTSLRAVLDDYCSQKDLNANEWVLLHKNKRVDLSLPFRLSGLSNNATLTLAPRGDAAVGPAVVALALQLDDGARVQQKFVVTASLWQVLRAFEATHTTLNLTRRMGPAPAPEATGLLGALRLSSPAQRPTGWLQPVLTVVNKQFATVEELCGTTLQSLGISGSVAIRLTFQWTERAEPPQVNDNAGPDTVIFVPPAAVQRPTKREKADAAEEEKEELVRVEISPLPPAAAEPAEEAAPAVVMTVPEDRNVVVFAPTGKPVSVADIEVPDDFYELTPAEVKALMNQGGKRSDEPLMTREFREKKALASYSKFGKTNLRIRFPNGWELQGTFLPSEATGQVEEFVRRHIVTPDRAFELYTTPPRQALPPTTLLKQRLVPAAVIYFSWRGEGPAVDQFLTQAALDRATTLGSSGQHLSTFSNSAPVTFDMSAPADTGSAKGTSGKGKEEASEGGGGKKVPAWLKLGGKK